MIKVHKIKLNAGTIYEAIAVRKGITVRASTRRKALKKLAKKIDKGAFKKKVKDFIKKFLHIK